MKNKFVLVSIALTFVILIGGVFLLTKKNNKSDSLPDPANYEYYWSKTCPHCAKVSEFMQSWPGKDKIKMDKYEVNETRENTSRFIARGEYCKFPKEELGVPLLITPDGLCLSGDEPIIDHLKELKF